MTPNDPYMMLHDPLYLMKQTKNQPPQKITLDPPLMNSVKSGSSEQFEKNKDLAKKSDFNSIFHENWKSH